MKYKIAGCLAVFVILIVIYAILNSGPSAVDDSTGQQEQAEQQ